MTTEFNGLEFFERVYGQVPDWAAKMHYFAPKALEYYTKLRGEILVDGALSKKEKELILVGINAARRYERSMIYHTKGAIDSGATIEELADVLSVCIISRGIPAWFTGVEAIKYAISYCGDGETAAAEAAPALTEDDFFASLTDYNGYYKQETGGEVPNWVKVLNQFNPACLERYTDLRRSVLRDDVVSRKLKELVLVGINVAEMYPRGIELHMKGAKRFGATDAEIADVSLVALLTAGIPAWFEGSDFLSVE
ncbi:carboxymuconolactone decarboxylase family protein [Neobacillus muris]|uniref:carboxymuconolactone decarboxylase family protein n=1 Tax=Neobacillus muris TaxID=2941334 RepID=UPI00204028DD|nr:carboxymuconolactone decarboxylase family protein [Neobacillus muris]